MDNEVLNWSQLDWPRFQLLSLYLAQSAYSDIRFEEYLKPGHKQDGIDLISTTKAGKYIAIQCKKVERLTKSDLNRIQKEFVQGKFFEQTSTFILSTTADLQSPAIKDHLAAQAEALEQYGVVFEVWDRSYLSTQLKLRYDLVEKYFGSHAADQHCFAPVRYQEFKNREDKYIPRRVFSLALHDGQPYWRWRLRKDDTLTITEILQRDRYKPRTICLIGDPYQGKTFFLKQTAYELTQISQPLKPIWIELKTHTVQPIEQLLQIQIGAWKSTPAMDLVIFLDGLDEVPSDRFTEAIDYIRDFADKNPSLTVIFSCRKLFYNLYRVSSLLPKFETYELYDLNENDVNDYLKKTLASEYLDFIKEVDRLGLRSLLYDPFYLPQLIQAYQESPYQIPNSRLEVIDRFINKSIKESELRKLSSGVQFHMKERNYNICIRKFAFALQAMGVNAFTEQSMQQLFSSAEQELLKHSALITHSGGQWSFTSALFQEFLSARVLVAMEPDDVIPLVTVGTEIRKIKQKWLQTFTTLLGFTPHGSNKEQRYLEVMEADNIELIFQTERSKYTADFRLDALKRMINQCASKGIRPLAVRENEIGDFVGGDGKSIDFLIKTLKSARHSVVTKITCCRILEHTKLKDDVTIKRLEGVLITEFRRTDDVDYATCCIELLDVCDFFDTKFIKEATLNTAFNDYYPYRQALYRIINRVGQTDSFYNYGIEGFPVLRKYNTGIRHTFSEESLITFLTSARKPENLKALYMLSGSDEWSKFFEYDSFGTQRFMKLLTEQTVAIFKEHPQIILALIDHIRSLNLRSMGDEFPDFDAVFERTGTRIVIVEAFYKEILEGKGWQLGCLLSEEAFDYFLFEFEEGGYPTSALRAPVIALMRKPSKKDVFERLNTIARCLEAVEPLTAEDIRWQAYHEFEAQKWRNDIVYMQSQESFIQGLKEFFDAHGTKTVSEEALDAEFENRSSIREVVPSNLMYSLLVKFIKDKRISLQACLNWLECPGNYSMFIVSELLYRDFANTEEEPIVLGIFERYYSEGIASANFEHAYRTTGKDKGAYRTKEYLLGEIFQKYSFPTPSEVLTKFIWMDTGGIRKLFQHTGNGKPSLAELVLKRIQDEQRPAFRKEIVANMRKGIPNNSVFGTHVSLCVYLKIDEALPVIFDRIKQMSKAGEVWHVSSYIDAYVDLKGDLNKLRPFLNAKPAVHYYPFFSIANHLKPEYPKLVQDRLLELMSLPQLPAEDKTKAALMLASMGNKEGFTFIIHAMKTSGLSPTDLPEKYPITNQDTTFALNTMQSVRHLILKVDNPHDPSRRDARQALLEWTFQLSQKSEDDLKKVVRFFEQARKDFAAEPEASMFTRFAEHYKKRFSETGTYLENMTEVRRLLGKISELLADE